MTANFISVQKRQALILKLVVDEYVKTAEPVSSQLLCARYDLPCSPATVRNDMLALEEEGFLYQPHTSAGRVPTEEGYRFYLANFLKPKPVRPDTLREPNDEIRTLEAKVQMLGRRLAELSGEAVMMTNNHQTTTSGMANLLRKPDFREENMLLALAEDIERLEREADRVLSVAPDDVKVLLGEENPLGRRLATVIVRHRLPNGEIGVLSIVGPLRMNYARNVALLAQAKKIIEEME